MGEAPIRRTPRYDRPPEARPGLKLDGVKLTDPAPKKDAENTRTDRKG